LNARREGEVRSHRARAIAFVCAILGYVLLGLAGLQLQSSQAGVTPVWPASGFIFAMAYWFGLWQVVAVLPGMLILAWMIGVPTEVAAIAALGGILEVAVPVYLVRRFQVDPGLAHLRDTLLFVAFVSLLGPALGATVGGVAFAVMAESPLGFVRLWLLWCLGDSIGMLVVGGAGLVAIARGSLRIGKRRLTEVIGAGTLIAAIMTLGTLQVVHISSPLILYLLIPVFVFIAQRADQYLVMLQASVAMAVLLLSVLWLPRDALAQVDLGILYLDVALLWVVVFTGMVTASARQEMRMREKVSWLVNHDPLTRLLNRHALMERLEDLLARHRERAGKHALLFLDLDRFKELNDAEGHRAGDRVLRDVGVLLGEELRATDSLARIGGDEFAVILEDCGLLDACSIAENIRNAIERYEYRGELQRHRVEVSIGLLELGAEHTSPEDALHAVDSACYEAKRAGRNRVWVHANDRGGGSEATLVET
jgi:diguanylate cyclase (GGDEF)-like protein